MRSKNGGYTGDVTTTGELGSTPNRRDSTIPTLTSVAIRMVVESTTHPQRRFANVENASASGPAEST
jgi:hypothetical protein